MARYTDFTLLWKEWGGYFDRDEPFGFPTLVCVMAKGDRGASVHVWRESVGAMECREKVAWKEVPHEKVEQLRRVLAKIGAYGELHPLVESSADGEYCLSWEFSGVDAGRPFAFAVDFRVPGETWSQYGEELRDLIRSLGVK